MGVRHLVWMLLVAVLAGAEPPDAVLGPREELGLLEDFTADRQALWTAASGSNVGFTVTAGYELPGVAETLLRCEPVRRDPTDREPGHNWFKVGRGDLPAGIVPAECDGLIIVLGSHRETKWWIQLVLTLADGRSYSTVVADASFPAGRMVQFELPLEVFRSADREPLTAALAAGLSGISLVTSTPGCAFYVDRIGVYRQERLTGWLDVTTNQPEHHLFEPGEPVRLTFTLGGTPPPGTAGFRYQIGDWTGTATDGGTVPLGDANEQTVDATPATHGYYEVTAFWIDADGAARSPRSCIRAEGTVPTGLATFAVLPTSIEANLARFREVGQRAYYGLHGDFLGLADRCGLAWRFGYTGWKWLEPERPARAGGPAPWAAAAIERGPEPAYRFHLLPMRPNLRGEIPAWALREGPEAPPFSEWDDYLAMLRDAVRVERARYPHQQPRLYGGAWELNLNMPPYVSQQPEFSPEQVVELFRRTREVVKAEDPDGLLLGPCPSVLDLAWFETVFRAGVLGYLDGIETHGYVESAYHPEENDFAGKLAGLRALMRRYNHGRELPIYITEAGYRGMLGGGHEYGEQAKRMVRTAIVCQGEGVQAFLAFFGIDYDRHDCFGFLFNKDVDGNPWSTRRCSPKPLVNAMAACSLALEGATPRGRAAGLDDDLWVYRFTRDGRSVTAAWTIGPSQPVRLPAAGEAEVMDFLGHRRPVEVMNGTVELVVGDAPQYLLCAGPD